MLRILPLLVLTAALSGGGAPVRAQEPSSPRGDEVLLENELPVSGPQVFLHLRYGWDYHPGTLQLAEGRIVWPGGLPPQGAVGITVTEGNGPRYGERFPAGGASVFSFPFQAPAGAADLRFSLWQIVNGEPQDLLRTSLLPYLKVRSAQDRVVLRCGLVSRLVVPPQWHTVVVTPRELPEHPWMYDNVDLVILGREALHGNSAASKGSVTALRNWVLGGGRVLIASADSASQRDQDAAVRAGLTPLERDAQGVPDRPPLWPGNKHDPTKEGCEIRYDAKRGYEMVYAHYRLGLGGGSFFMPSANPDSVDGEGVKVFNEPVLSAPRPLRSDVRIWAQPFDFFAPGTLPDERRIKTGTWALIGAICILAMLAFARSIRTRYLAAGVSLAAIGLLAALLARTFPRPELTLARVEWVDLSLDGRAKRTTEWALCEGSWDPRNVLVRAARGATLSPLYASSGELGKAAVELSGENELTCRITSSLLPPAAPLFQSIQVQEATGGSPRTLEVPGERVRLRVSSAGFNLATAERGVIWLTDDGRRLILRPEGPAFRTERLTDERWYVRERFPGADEATVGAWAKALTEALDEAKRQRRVCLVQCADRPAGEGLIRAEGGETEEGICFSVRRAEAAQEVLEK